MNKAIKLHVGYNGYYGGNVDEYCILPIEWNGLYMESLEEGFYESEISLGEIEGKHSECYGDLTISVINLDELSYIQRTNLIEGSDTSQLIGYFEGKEESYIGDVEYMEEEDIEDIKNKQSALEKKLDVKPNEYSVLSELVSENFVYELKKNMLKIVPIYVLDNDHEKSLQILKNNEIKTF